MTRQTKAISISLAMVLAVLLGAVVCLARDEVLYITVDKLPSGLTAESDEANIILKTVQAVRAELGDSGETEFLPWARGLYMLSQDRPTAMFPLFRTGDREDLYQWAGPIARLEWGLFQLVDAREQINGIEEAREKASIIGTFRQAPRRVFLQTLGFSVEEANSAELNVSKLVHGRVQLIVFSRAGSKIMRTNPKFAGVELRPAVGFEPEDLFVAFSRATDPDYVRQWNAAFERLRESGGLDRIWKEAGPQLLLMPK